VVKQQLQKVQKGALAEVNTTLAEKGFVKLKEGNLWNGVLTISDKQIDIEIEVPTDFPDSLPNILV